MWADLRQGVPALPAALASIRRRPRWVVVGFVGGWLLLAVAVWLPNWRFLKSILSFPGFGLIEKARFAGNLLPMLFSGATPLVAILTLLNVLLFGLTVALLGALLERRRGVPGAGSSASFLGGGASLLGIGCAACGSVVLSVIGLAGAMALLPLRGVEFSLLAAMLQVYGLSATARRVVGDRCPIPPTNSFAPPIN